MTGADYSSVRGWRTAPLTRHSTRPSWRPRDPAVRPGEGGVDVLAKCVGEAVSVGYRDQVDVLAQYRRVTGLRVEPESGPPSVAAHRRGVRGSHRCSAGAAPR